jgi:hypothetical protein
MPKSLSALAIRLILSSTLFACSEGRVDAGVTVRDSAGVTIVENTEPLWAEGEGWRLSAEPALTIGMLDGPEEYQLYQVTSALRLADGGFAIANRGSNDLRFYDESGMSLYFAGREGEGPGEFKMLSWMWALGADSLVIFDYGTARFSVFNVNGEFGRTFRLDAPDGGVPVARGLIDGPRMLMETSVLDQAGEIPAGVHRDSLEYSAYSLEGERLETLGRFPGSDRYGVTIAGSRSVASRPYGLDAQVAAAADRWFTGTSETYEIQVHALDGTLQRIVRRAFTNRPMPAGFAEEYRARQAGRFWAQIPLPETLPAYERFIVDADGYLWVKEYILGEEEPRWAVFDPEGRFLGLVDLPADGRVTQIGADYVLGVWRGELDVEQVRMYSLLKTAPR